MQFQVRALDSHLRLKILVIEAADVQEASTLVRAQGLQCLSAVAVHQWLSWSKSSRKAGIDATLFAEELLALVSAGLSVVEAIDVLIDRGDSAEGAPVLRELRNQLRDGKRLSQAMEEQADLFPPLLIGLTQAAEDTSNLPLALERFAQYDRQVKSLGQRIASACIYPMILLTVGGLVTLFLLGHVVPKFASIYQGSTQKLPLASRWLMAWGQWVAEHSTLVWLGAAFVALLVASKLVPIVRNNHWWDLIRWIPGANAKLALFDISRIYLTLGMLLESGIPITRAMQLTTSVVHLPWRAEWANAQNMIRQGYPLTKALGEHGLSTPVAQRLLAVGEKSGQVGSMLNKIAAFHESETARWIERFSKTFEPVLMALIGLVVGLIVILLYIPVFELAGSLR